MGSAEISQASDGLKSIRCDSDLKGQDMPTVNSGSNATVSLNAGDIITVEPQEKATARFESPTGTLDKQFNDRRSFGPYAAGRSVKVVSVVGSLFYEVSTSRSMGGQVLSPELNVGIFFGTGAPTMAAGKGSLYLRLDGSSTSTRAYLNTDGATGWTNLVTAA